MILQVPLAALFFLASCIPHTSDQQLIELLTTHQDLFTGAVNLVQEHPTIRLLSTSTLLVEGTLAIDLTANPNGYRAILTTQEWDECNRVFKQLGGGSVKVDRGRGRIFFEVDSPSLRHLNSQKGFVYSLDEPSPLYQSLNRSRIPDGEQIFNGYRRIRGNWYVYLFIT